MITVRKSTDRGHFANDWLDSRHTFSFGEYHDPNFMGFRALRVINEDKVAPGGGFPTHAHRDMEIVTYVLDGALEHKDSIGSQGRILPGDIQRMSAGTGIRHSEFNGNADKTVHFLQIWILPEAANLPPSYQQVTIPAAGDGRLQLVGARAANDGMVIIYQDVSLFVGKPKAGDRLTHKLGSGRYGYVHVARGTARVNGQELSAGDAAAFADEPAIDIHGLDQAELLVFDLG
jgi:redox-sensitive bicupin YhaK (pirin superfamily)